MDDLDATETGIEFSQPEFDVTGLYNVFSSYIGHQRTKSLRENLPLRGGKSALIPLTRASRRPRRHQG